MPEAAPKREAITAPEALEPEAQEPARFLGGLTWRVFGLFLVLAAIVVVWTEYSTLVVNSTSFDSLAPAITAVFPLAVIVALLNPLLKLLGPRFALSSRETTCLYCMLMVAVPVAGIGMVEFLLPTMVSARYFATAENKWGDLFLQYVPTWFGPTDETAISTFWESSRTAAVPWDLWVKPLALWSLFGLALFVTMLCLTVIIRKQWMDAERLTFPLVYLPLEMVREEPGRLLNSFFRNRLMWIAVVIAIIPQAMAGLHVYYPQVPDVPVKSYPLHPYLRSAGAPWNAIGTFQLSFYPCMIGFSYLLTAEVSLAGWVFYLLGKAERIVGGMSGFTAGGGQAEGAVGFPFEEQQALGAWLMLVAFGLWIGRAHFLNVLRSAIRPESGVRQPGEPMSYRAACLGLLLAIASLCLWTRAAGLAVWVSLLFFGLLFVKIVALTRIRAEAGLGCISGPMQTQDFMYALTGTRAYGARNMAILEHFRWFSREFRGAPTIMPCQLEALKIGQETGLRGRDLVLGILLGIVIIMVMGHIATLQVTYKHGGVTMNNWRFLDMPRTPFIQLAKLLTSPKGPDWLPLGFVGIGAVFMTAFTFMRMRFTWWPLHPVGFALGFTKRSVHWIWFPMFLSWAIKTSVIRYGGYKLYRTLLPFFLGLILGDFLIGAAFGVAGALVPKPGYCVFP